MERETGGKPELQAFAKRMRELRAELSRLGMIPPREGYEGQDEREDFAVSIGVRGGAVGNWELGNNNMKEIHMRTLHDFYGVNTDWLRSGRGEMFMSDGTRGRGKRGRGATPDEVETLPVYATESVIEGAFVVKKPTPLERIDMPSPLSGRTGAYGLFVSGSGMAPAFRYGDIALVDPLLPPTELTEVVLIRAERHEGEEVKMICTLVGFDDESWTVVTSPAAPTHQTTLSRTEWPKCHRIVGKFARR